MSAAAEQARHYAEIRARLFGRPASTAIPRPRLSKERDFIFVQLDPLDEAPGTLRRRWKQIVREVCEKHQVEPGAVMGPTRAKKIIAARFEAYYRLRNETTLSLPEIGARLGGKDHTGVLHGIRCHEASLRGEVYQRPRYVKAREAVGP